MANFLTTLILMVLVCSAGYLRAQTSPVTPGQPEEVLNRAGTLSLGSDQFRVQELSQGKWLLSTERAMEYQARITVQGNGELITRVLSEWTGLDSSYRFVMYRWFESMTKELELDPYMQQDPLTEAQLARSYPGQATRVAVFSSNDKLRREVLVFYATDEGAYFSHLQQQF